MEIAVRSATEGDIPALRAVIGSEPSDEQVALAGGDRRKASRLRQVLMASVGSRAAIPRTVVAVADGEAVGLLQSGREGAGISPGLIWGLLRVFGPLGMRRFLQRDRLRSRVHIPVPEGTFHIAEVHVLSERRNLGIGAALMAEAERMARAGGFAAMSLTTTTSNPARRLYERSGFEVVKSTSDEEYRRCTGIDGRVLMLKRLD